MKMDAIEDTTWTVADIIRESKRRQIEDLLALGPRPPWWRMGARRHYDRRALRLAGAHANDLQAMLAEQDPRRRAILAHLIGWKPPELT